MGTHAVRRPLAELKLLAGAEMISTAKRTATSLGSLVGFSLEELDELNIAVAQACDAAIEAGRRNWGSEATLKLSFWATERGLEVDVQAAPARSGHDHPEQAPIPSRPAQSHHAEHHRREEELRRLASRQQERQAELEQIAHDLIRCFVDDFQPVFGRNQVRFKMVKYLIGG